MNDTPEADRPNAYANCPDQAKVNEALELVIADLRRNFYRAGPAARPGLIKATLDLSEGVRLGTLKADTIFARYITLAYARLGTLNRAADATGVPRTTMVRYIDRDYLTRIEAEDDAAYSGPVDIPKRPDRDAMNWPDWISVDEAAPMLARSAGHLRRLCEARL